MTPSTRRQGRQVQPKISSRPVPSTINVEDQRRLFREARMARERERFEAVRNSRLKSSAAAVSSVVASTSSSHGVFTAPRKLFQKSVTEASESRKNNSKPLKVQTKQDVAPTKVQKSRRSYFNRKEALNKVSKTQKPVRKYPKAEVKLTKTAQLRLIKSDPLLQLSAVSNTLSQSAVLPVPKPFVYSKEAPKNDKTIANPSGGNKQQLRGQKKHSQTWEIKPLPTTSADFASPSRIPVKKTSFLSPIQKPKTVPSTPKPSPLREKLSQWLEKRNQSLDDFKHLKCFGVLGPVVRRPHTPFRKTMLSTSTLKAIPESKETTPNKDPSQGSSENIASPPDELNTTFTLEDEDKENIPDIARDEDVVISTPHSESLKEFDQSEGVLSELFKVIQMGYPANQCDLWLRAIRRRFPQCGDEPIYWECLASLEEARGDLSSALSCYECAIQHGAQGSVQKSIDELLRKMTALRIDPPAVSSESSRGGAKSCKDLDSSNIIKSSAIQFEIQEKCNSSRKNSSQDAEVETVLTATPVRRSLRLAGTPNQGTPGVTCVRSLNFLEPHVRSSLVFFRNNALDPED